MTVVSEKSEGYDANFRLPKTPILFNLHYVLFLVANLLNSVNISK